MIRRLSNATIVLAVASLACSTHPAGSTTKTFCDVAPIIGQHCGSCHASVPQFGAPMPLMTAEDFAKPSVTNPAVPVWQAVQNRLHEQTNPMPPDRSLSASDLTVLDQWLVGGREKGSCDTVPLAAHFTGQTGVESLPCKADVYVTATSDTMADGSALTKQDYPVPLYTDDYVCFALRIPAKVGRQMTAAAPILKDTRVIHHMILYQEQSSNQLPSGPHDCTLRSNNAVPLILWGPGAGGLVLPGDVGLELGDDDVQFDLEIHYNNATRIEDAVDHSGFGLCTTDQPRPNKAQVATVGTLFFTIPPKQNGVDGTLSLTNVCTPNITQPTRILATAPHMHALGKAMKTEILRADGRVETLIDDENYNFSNQVPYPVDFTLGQDDRLRTTCTWDNPHDYPVKYGGRTTDEMCFNFMLYYPAGQLAVPGFPAEACVDPDEVTQHKGWPP